MNQFENNTISMHCDFIALSHSISSKLEEFKKYILKLLVNENSQLLGQYSYYYNPYPNHGNINNNNFPQNNNNLNQEDDKLDQPYCSVNIKK